MTQSTPEKLRVSEKLGYGLGDTASNFFFHTFNILLLGYYTDVFGLTATAVGTMFLVTKLFDAFTDPIMGMIADRTKTRWGKFRPYILWTAVPFGVIGYAMFANPDLSDSGKLVYAYFTYSLMMLAYTVINVTYSSLLGVISPDSSERTMVSTYRFVCAFGAQLLISAFVIPLRDLLGGGDEGLGYQRTMALFAAASVILWFITFLTTKERVEPAADQQVNFSTDLGVVFRNSAWIALVVVAVLTLTNVGVRGGATYFYVKYYINDSDKMVFWIFDRTSIAWLSGGLGMLVGTLLTKPLTEVFDKRTLMVWLTGLNGLFMLGMFLIGPDQYWLMIIVGFIGTIIVGPTPAIVWSMYADVADYGEWKFGRRTTGLVFSGLLFSQKMGLAIGAGLAGWILGWFGYAAGAEQSESSLLGIRLLFTVFPGVLTLAAALATLFYPLNDKRVQEIDTELNKRRGAVAG
ncbi:MFS transporter [Pelagicoccus mobilis]|uniref:MFS transporter n=1 Tax=Pelagicoccus mobilis TaxID=415221 RepID=A0A934RW60_9BACT|nr:MFS transporter [Pelagicoccus mobilis]MBK1877922.1 MFS transporter [Pelagicoccus mobilis]